MILDVGKRLKMILYRTCFQLKFLSVIVRCVILAAVTIYLILYSWYVVKNSSLKEPNNKVSGCRGNLTSAHRNLVVSSQTKSKHAVWFTNMIHKVQQTKKDHPNVMTNWNLVKTKTISTLSNFKNPCWYEKTPLPSNCEDRLFRPITKTETTANEILRCLPYFYLVGMPKCGTTDLYKRLILHPQIAKAPQKEPIWIDRIRITKPKCSGLNAYIDYFDKAAKRIESNYTWTSSPGGARERYHDMVTGDGSVSIMVNNMFWPELPGNENCSSVCVTNADIVHHISPHAKIIVSLRKPVDRLYSHYLFRFGRLNYKPSPDAFHQEVVRAIDEFQQCMKTFSLRSCVYNGTFENFLSHVTIETSIYYVHISDWLRVFPRDQIHIIRFEEYTKDIKGEMTKLFNFLQLGPVNNDTMKTILNISIANKSPSIKAGITQGGMKPETRDILEEFYKPFNEKLAELLNDNKYKFMKQNESV